MLFGRPNSDKHLISLTHNRVQNTVFLVSFALQADLASTFLGRNQKMDIFLDVLKATLPGLLMQEMGRVCHYFV